VVTGRRIVRVALVEGLGTGAVVGALLAAIDLGQIALRNPASLQPTGPLWLVGFYLAGAVLAAVPVVALVAVIRGDVRARAVGWTRGGLLAAGGFLLGAEAALDALTPISPWKPAALAAVGVGAAVLLWPLARGLRRVPRWAGALVVVALAVGGWGAVEGFGSRGRPARTESAPVGHRPNILLVVIDTTRADHLSCYGYERPTSPHVDAFAAEATLFERAFSQSSWTKPSMASMLTGHFPTMHQTNLETSILPPTEELVTEHLQAEGYRTAVLSGNPWVTPDYGFARGVDYFFSIYDERFARVTQFMRTLKRLSNLMGDRKWVYNRVKLLVQGELSTTARDEVVAAEAVRWLEQNRAGPFYMHIQLMSPHHPYDPPPPFDKFVPDRTLKPVTYYPKKSYLFFEHGDPLDDAQRRDMVARYDGDILFADTVFGGLLDKMRALGLLDDTIVVLTSDHGEEFYEHRNWGHGHSVYNEVLHVPLIVRYPTVFAPGQRVDATVMSIDIVPTLLALVQSPPMALAAGRSLVDAGRRPRSPDAFSELIYKFGAARAVVSGEEKLIDLRQGDRTQNLLYDLRDDFGEQHDLAASSVPETTRMTQELDAVRDWAAAHQAEAESAVVSDETEQRLKALGYANH
jgi:arylsulfatase A-like enzyme